MLIKRRTYLFLFGAGLLSIINSCNLNQGANSKTSKQDTAAEKLPAGFVDSFAAVNGAKLYYRMGGQGPVLLLLHGFPEDGSAFKKIMPLAALHYSVIVPDLRGIGKSEATTGYDAQNIARDFHDLLKSKGVQSVYVVGLDMSGNVAYAFARLYPEMTKGVILAEAPLAGLDPWNEISANVWHIPFQESLKVPELLIQGKQASYFRYEFFTVNGRPSLSINGRDLLHYANAYKSTAQLNAGLGLYRAVRLNTELNLNRKGKLDVPIKVVNAENSLGPFTARAVTSLRRHGATNISYDIIKNASHYLADEDPEKLYSLILKFFN